MGDELVHEDRLVLTDTADAIPTRLNRDPLRIIQGYLIALAVVRLGRAQARSLGLYPSVGMIAMMRATRAYNVDPVRGSSNAGLLSRNAAAPTC